MAKNKKIDVGGVKITISEGKESDFISLTDMLKAKDGDFFIHDWLRNRNTLEYLAAWETIKNPSFNYGEFAIIKSSAGLNSFKISIKEWVEKTGAIGITAKAGRYGGTYAHTDIAFNFGMWISPVFQLYLVKEYQRLKRLESSAYNLEWNVKRVLSKVNYTVHTDAIKNYVIPNKNLAKEKEWLVYAEEADILNVALFGCTARQWKDANPAAAKRKENIRDTASINELTVLSNLESYNAQLIKDTLPKRERFLKLREMAIFQLKSLDSTDFVKSLKFTSDSTYQAAADYELNTDKTEAKPLSRFNKNLKKALGFNPKEDIE